MASEETTQDGEEPSADQVKDFAIKRTVAAIEREKPMFDFARYFLTCIALTTLEIILIRQLFSEKWSNHSLVGIAAGAICCLFLIYQCTKALNNILYWALFIWTTPFLKKLGLLDSLEKRPIAFIVSGLVLVETLFLFFLWYSVGVVIWAASMPR